MDEIIDIVSTYNGNGTWKNQSRMLNVIANIVSESNISKDDTIDAIRHGLLNSQYLSGAPSRDIYCKNLAIAAWKRIEWRLLE